MACGAGSIAADSTLTVLTLTGDLLPDGLTSVTPFGPPVLNDLGQAVFVAAPILGPGAGSVGLVQDSAAGPIGAVASAGQLPTGSATGLDTTFTFAQVNGASDVFFTGFVTGSFHQVLVQGSAGTTPETLVEAGDIAPGGTEPFQDIRGGSQGAVLGDGGHAAFTASLVTGVGNPVTSGLYRVNPDGAVIELVRAGDAVPGGDGAFGSFYRLNGQEIDGVSINASGHVAFRAGLDGTSLGAANNTGIFKSDGLTLTKIVRDGDPLPSGLPGQKFADTRFVPAFNDAGQAAFEIAITGPGISASNNEAIYRGDGTTLTQIARKGDAPPEGNGVFLDLNSFPNLNGVGGVVFLADLTGTSAAGSDNRGIYTGSGGALTKVAREGDASPDGNGVFASSAFLSQPVINDDGQVAFNAFLSGTAAGTGDNEAIFFYDPTEGLQVVARKGDTLAGSTITDLNFAVNAFRNTPDAGSGLNDESQVAFLFSLADGRTGIGLWEFVATVLTGIAGDYNNSGLVEQGDLDLVLLNWGSDTAVDGVPSGWINDLPTGLIDQAELDGVLLNWGDTAEPVGGTVPEPASLGALALLMAGLASRRRPG